MNKYILSLFTFCIYGFLFGQIDAPTVDWKYHDIAPNTVNNSMVEVTPGFNQTPGAINSYEGSGEEWWYDIVNIYEGGEHVGYLAAGFASWINIDFDETNVGGCHYNDAQSPDCNRPVLSSERISYKPGTIARYDLRGNMIWCKAYVIAEEGFYSISATNNENEFMVVGWGRSTKSFEPDVNGSDDLIYNPGTSNYFLNSDCAQSNAPRLIGAKINADGDLLWMNSYGYYDTGNAAETTLAMNRSTIGVDVIEKNTGGFRFIGYSTTEFEPNVLSKIVVIDTDDNGLVTGKELYGDDGLNHECRAIETDGTAYYISIVELQPNITLDGFDYGDAVLMKIDENLNQVNFGNQVYNGINAVRVDHNPNGTVGLNNNVPHDVIAVGDNIVWAVIEECNKCLTSDNNMGLLNIYVQDQATGSLVQAYDMQALNSYNFAQVHAFDMKAGLVATQDGGFAVVSGFQSTTPNPLIEPYASIISDLDGQTALNCSEYTFPDNQGGVFVFYWETDAYVAKFDANGQFIWDISFDSDDGPIENYPGDWKEQECVYRLTEASDGSLVFVGNTSHNKDDYYIAKINSDCGLRKDINGEYDIHFFDVGATYPINANTTWDINNPIFNGSNSASVYGSVVVKTGNTLTIDGMNLEFADSRKMPEVTNIVVEPGAHLILTGGTTLTSLSDCDNTMWDGIQVWGTSSQPQDPTFQGKLTMEDGATIENAIIGVACVKRDGFQKDLDFTGGILDIENSNFRNNLIGIEMRPYSNNSTGPIVDNISNIRLTNFIIDGPLNDHAVATTTQITSPSNGLRETVPRAHQEFILLDGVRGVKIRGNDFKLDNTNPYIAAIEEDWRGYGILSWDSDFELTSHSAVINDPNPTPNTFENLWIGAYCKPMGAVNDVFINDNVFTNNHYGVAFVGAVNYSKITNNEFNVAESPAGVPLEDANAAIYASGATGLKIEANDIFGISQSGVGVNGGIFVAESSPGGGSAEIYRNTFDLLDVSVQTVKNNSLINVDCNEFNKDPFEDAVIWHNAEASVLPPQGFCDPNDNEAPQANEFIGLYNFANYHILNEGDFFPYRRFDANGFGVTNQLGSFDVNCNIPLPSESSRCPVRNAPPDFPVVGIQIEDLVQEIAQLSGLIDNGDTDGLVEMINTTTSQVQIRNNLLEVAPYLSDEVLVAMIEKPNMQPSFLNQILLANEVSSTKVLEALINSPNNYPAWVIRNQILSSSPVDESVLVTALNRQNGMTPSTYNAILTANSPLKDETLLAMLASENNIPNWVVRNVLSLNTPLSEEVDLAFQSNSYPNWVYNQVYSSGVVAEEPASKVPPSSTRIDLENEIEYLKVLKARQVDYLVSYYLDNNNFEPAVLLLEEQNTIEGSCLLLPLLLETKDGIRLYQHIQKIRDDADQDPTSPRSKSLYAFCDYYEVMFEIRTQPGGIDAVTSTQLTKLLVLSNLAEAISVNALNVLDYLELKEGIALKMVNIDFGGVQKAPIYSNNNEMLPEAPTTNDFKLYPNPTNSEVHVQYDINDLSKESTLYIVDLSGKMIHTEMIYDQHNELVLDVSALDKGVYLVTITSEMGEVTTKKLIVH